MQTILISTDSHGPWKVDAELIGPFAIHATPRGNARLSGEGYTVTHLFTGMALCHGVTDRDEARYIATHLNQIDDWYFGWLDIRGPRNRLANSENWLEKNDYR